MKRREVAVLKKIKTKVEEEMEKEDKEGLSVKKSNNPPRFAHICKTIRKKEERKKLRGFDCKLCENSYQAHHVLIQLVPVVEAAAADFTKVKFTLSSNLELDD